MMNTRRVRILSLLIPYAAVLVGLNIFHCAWLALGLYHLGMLVIILLFGSTKELLKKFLKGWDAHWAVAMVVMPALIIPLFLIFWKYMRVGSVDLDSLLVDFGLKGWLWGGFMIYFSTVQPLIEELFWRGHLLGKHQLLCVEDFAFAGYHILVLAWFLSWPWLLLAFVSLVLVALIWRHLAIRLSGLAVPLVSHITADVSIIAIAYLLRSQTGS